MRIVLFSLDEILVDGRVIDTLALKYGFYYDLNRLRTNLKNGLMTRKQVTRSIIKLLKGRRVDEVTRMVRSIPLMPNTISMFGSLKSRGYKLGIISDELTIVTDSFAERFKLDYSIGHEVEIKDGKLAGKVYLASNEGEHINWKKEKIVEIRNKTNSKIIAIGNDDVDAPMLREADIGIAFNATPKAKRASDIIINDKDMNKVLDAINKVVLYQ